MAPSSCTPVSGDVSLVAIFATLGAPLEVTDEARKTLALDD
jgi:hypothetical protein